MARRIRSIKPEILDDEKTAGLSHEAWRLFVSMWTLADDHGGLRCEPSWLDGQVFWSTPCVGGVGGVEDALAELAAEQLIMLYEVRGQRYTQISNWTRHQRVDHPSKPQVPRPTDDGAWPVPQRKSDRVYFIQSASGDIKIGVSWNPSRRLASLQEGSREALILVADAPGGRDLERALHIEFADDRISGEWFRCSDKLLSKISELSSAVEGTRKSSRGSSRGSSPILAPDLDMEGSGREWSGGDKEVPDVPVPGTSSRAERIPDRAWKAADVLREQVLVETPSAAIGRKPWVGRAGARLAWADSIRLIVDRDGKSYDELWLVMKWLRDQPLGKFRTVVQSPAALREKWDAISARRASEAHAGSKPAGSVFAAVDRALAMLDNLEQKDANP